MEDNKEQELDQILSEVHGETATPAKPVFKLDLDLDSEYGEPIPMTVSDVRETPQPAPIVVHTEAQDEEEETEPKKGHGCLKGVIYAFVVLLLAGLLSYVLIVGGLDLTGITRSDLTVDITVPAGVAAAESNVAQSV